MDALPHAWQKWTKDKSRKYVPQIHPLSELPALIAERATAAEIRRMADNDVEDRNADILATLRAADLKRYQTETGAIVQILAPLPRKSVNADKLMKAGVPIDVILACTDETPVAPFIRIDAPSPTPTIGGHDAAAPADDVRIQ